MDIEHPIDARAGTDDDAYVPPAVEQVLSPEDLAREVHYAGVDSGAQPPG